MKKCICIYNPVSGDETFSKKLDIVEDKLNAHDFQVEFVSTKKKKHAIKLVEEACLKEYDLLLVSGGDGTLNEVINGMAKSKKKLPIGYIPSGTICDIAHSLKIPSNIEKALDVILENDPIQMDYCMSNKGSFFYVSGIGAYIDISYTTDSRLKKFLGPVAYFLTGIKQFFTIPMIKAKIEYDKGFLRGHYSLLLVVNSKKVAGFNVINRPILDDGKVDVIIYKYIPFFNNLIYFLSFIIGSRLLPGVSRIKTSRLKIYTDHPNKWNMDGEEVNSGNLNVFVKKQDIQIIVPKKIRKKYFQEGK
ncbi:MAG: diacylglycerol kinase family lipid kinase [Candidatus Izimaplasma sp.]|nr:diacylglycerol kinase family lipid kinase [Candidatus Izimaplasma bacterium]